MSTNYIDRASEPEEVTSDMKIGLDLLSNYAKLISLLPLEKWAETYERADTLGPILEPTMYRDYLYRGHGEHIKKLIQAALGMKAVVLEINKAVLDGSIKL